MLAIAQALLTAAASLKRREYLIFFLLLFAPFSPRALGVVPGDIDISLTFPRVAVPLVTIVFIALIARSARHYDRLVPLLKEPFFQLLIILGIYKVITTAVNFVPISYAVESLVFSTIPFALFFILATRQSFDLAWKAVALIVILLVVIAPIEIAVQRPLFHFIADDNAIKTELLKQRIEGRGYRVYGFYDNTLQLAEFMLYCLPWALFKVMSTSGTKRVGALLIATSIIILGILTKSRGFMLFGALTTATFFTLYYWNRCSRQLRAILVVVLSLFAFVAASFFISAFREFLANAPPVQLIWTMDKGDISLLGRAMQFREVFDTVAMNPWVGVGVLQNFSRELETISRLDNYYLRVALESGLPGLVMFLLTLVIFFARFFTHRAKYRTQSERAFFAMACSLIVAFAGAKVFLSPPTSNYVFYAMSGLIFGMQMQFERLVLQRPLKAKTGDRAKLVPA